MVFYLCSKFTSWYNVSCRNITMRGMGIYKCRCIASQALGTAMTAAISVQWAWQRLWQLMMVLGHGGSWVTLMSMGSPWSAGCRHYDNECCSMTISAWSMLVEMGLLTKGSYKKTPATSLSLHPRSAPSVNSRSIPSADAPMDPFPQKWFLTRCHVLFWFWQTFLLVIFCLAIKHLEFLV